MNQPDHADHQSRALRVLWWVALVVALAIPPGATAYRATANDDLTQAVVTGLWLCKILLVGNLLVVPWVRRTFPRATTSGGIAPNDWPWIVGLTVVAFAVRVPGLNAGLWLDEIQTQIEYVRLPWGQMLTTFDTTNQHLLYSILAKVTQSVAGESAWTLRVPAMLFGVASIWASLWFGQRWMPRCEALWSAALLAVSYHHTWFSQNARGYTALLLGTLISSALMIDLLRGERSDARWIWGYAIATTLMLLTHVTGLIVVAAHGLCWLWQYRRLPAGPTRWAPFAAMTLAGTLTAAAYAPILPQVLSAVDRSGTSKTPVDWQNPAWFLAEAVRALIAGVPAGLIVVPAAMVIAALGLFMAWRRDRLATAMMVLPLALIAAMILSAGHNLWPRFFFFGAAFLVQLAVRGGFGILDGSVGRFKASVARPIGEGTLALAVLGSLVILPRAWKPKQDFARAVAWVEAHRGAGDVILTTDIARYVTRRWLDKDWTAVRDSSALRQHEAPQATTWVLYTFPIRLASINPGLWDDLRARYGTAETIPSTVGGGEIVILRHTPGTVPESRPK